MRVSEDPLLGGAGAWEEGGVSDQGKIGKVGVECPDPEYSALPEGVATGWGLPWGVVKGIKIGVIVSPWPARSEVGCPWG